MSTTIEWCDEVWNPVVGCSRVSAGCDHCYAMGAAHRKMSPQHVGLTKLRPRDASRPGVDWTGDVRTLAERLDEPLHWRKPRRVFVNSMSDLFHERVPFAFIAAVFGVMASAPRHTFLVLTKRPQRAVEFFAWVNARAAEHPEWPAAAGCVVMDAVAETIDPDETWRIGGPGSWPLPNVHLGVSAEDQATFDERVPLLLQCPAAVRWVSAEPLLGPIDCRDFLDEHRCSGHLVGRDVHGDALVDGCEGCEPRLDWIAVGGESGPGARPNVIDWTRSIIAECRDAGVPVFHKQVGARPFDHDAMPWPGRTIAAGPRIEDGGVRQYPIKLHDRKGGDMSEWPADLRVREYPEVRS